MTGSPTDTLGRRLAEAVAGLFPGSRGPGFSTVVAGTCVLGSEIAILTGRAGAAHALWVGGVVLWVVVMYAFFTATVIRQSKPTLETGINGAWLLGIVATQAVSVLGTLARARLRARAGARAVRRAVSSGPPRPGGSRCCSSSACGGTSSGVFPCATRVLRRAKGSESPRPWSLPRPNAAGRQKLGR